MNELLITLGIKKFVPPKGTLVPRQRVIPKSADEENATARKQSVIDNMDMIYDLIKVGINTSSEVSDHTGYTKAHVSGYFRRLEADGRCYRIEGKSNDPVRMFVY